MFKLRQLENYINHEGSNIFNASKIPNWRRLWGLLNATKFSPKNLENLLHQKLENLKMSELLKPCLITTYNLNSKSTFFFTSMEEEKHREFYVKDVLRSTSAAPTYFPSAKIRNIATDPRNGEDPKSVSYTHLTLPTTSRV